MTNFNLHDVVIVTKNPLVPTDCIKLCDSQFVQGFCKLEKELKSKEAEIIKLKEKSQTLGEAFNLVKVNLSDQGQVLMRLENDKINTKLSELYDEIIKVKEEMNTPINQRISWYLECQRYG